MSKSISQSVSQSVNFLSFTHSISQLGIFSFIQLVSQSVSQSVSQQVTPGSHFSHVPKRGPRGSEGKGEEEGGRGGGRGEQHAEIGIGTP